MKVLSMRRKGKGTGRGGEGREQGGEGREGERRGGGWKGERGGENENDLTSLHTTLCV